MMSVDARHDQYTDRLACGRKHANATLQTGLGPEYFDIVTLPGQRAPLRFTFYRPQTHRWEGEDFEVAVRPPLT
jgi:hypothetical protein